MEMGVGEPFTISRELNGEPFVEVDCFKYLLSQVAAYGGCERDVVHIISEGYGVRGALKTVLSNRGSWIGAKKCLNEGLIVQTALYGAEAWGVRSAKRRKVNVLEMKCLRIFFGVSRVRIEMVWACGKNG